MPIIGSLPGEDDPYAIEVRQGSDVSVTEEYDVYDIAISCANQTTLHLILPLDVAIDLTRLLADRVDRRTGGRYKIFDVPPHL